MTVRARAEKYYLGPFTGTDFPCFIHAHYVRVCTTSLFPEHVLLEYLQNLSSPHEIFFLL